MASQKGGGLQQAGAGLGVLGILALAASFLVPGGPVILASSTSVAAAGSTTVATTATFTLAHLGAGLTALGALTSLAGSFLTPFEARTPSGDRANSATYTFDAPRNPPKGDAVIPVPFGVTLVRGPVLASFATPKGLEADEEFGKVLRNNGQAVSMLVPMAPDRINDLIDVRLNQESLYRRFENDEGEAKQFATGNGSKTTFAVKAKRLVLDSVRVYVDGTLKGFQPASVTFQTTVLAGRRLYSVDSSGLDFSREITLTLDGEDIDGSGDKDWVLLGRGDGSDGFRVFTQTQWPVGKLIRVTASRRSFTGGLIRETANGFEAVFDSAPAAGAVIAAKYLRSAIKGTTVHIRRGTRHQLPLPGFDEVRQSRGLGSEEVTAQGVTFTTDDSVDDVRFTLTTGGAFLAQDEKGRRNPAQANFQVRFKPQGSAETEFLTLLDPSGAKKAPERKNGNEFRIVGETMNEQTFHLSVRGILEALVKKRPNSSKLTALLEGWTRQRYDFEIIRTSRIKAQTNPQFADRIYALSWTEVRDLQLSWPGIALLGFHGVGSKKLQGAFPLVETIVDGLADVEKWTGSAWEQDSTAARNPVWAAIEMWTNTEWGGGRQGMSKASNVDTASAKTAADWCAATVSVEGREGYTEPRARFDATLDTRQGLMAVIRDALLPAFIIPVLQGDTLRFAIDQAVDLSAVPVYSADAGSLKYIDQGGVQSERSPKSAQATELEAIYWDEEQEYDHREVFVPSAPGTAVRVRKRIELFGVTRRTQAARVTKFLHTQVVSAGPGSTFGITQVALRHEAGDVFGVTDTDAGITTTRYFRCTEVLWPSLRSAMVKMSGLEYVPASYGQEAVSAAVRQLAPPPPVSFVAVRSRIGPRTRNSNSSPQPAGRIALRRRA